MAVRQDRYRREALSLGVSPDNPETFRLIQCAERDAEALADLERLIALALRFAADEGTGRPAAAPPAGDAARPKRHGAAPGRTSFLARAAAALTGSASHGGAAV